MYHVPGKDRLPVADASQRFHFLENRLLLFFNLEEVYHLD